MGMAGKDSSVSDAGSAAKGMCLLALLSVPVASCCIEGCSCFSQWLQSLVVHLLGRHHGLGLIPGD